WVRAILVMHELAHAYAERTRALQGYTEKGGVTGTPLRALEESSLYMLEARLYALVGGKEYEREFQEFAGRIEAKLHFSKDAMTLENIVDVRDERFTERYLGAPSGQEEKNHRHLVILVAAVVQAIDKNSSGAAAEALRINFITLVYTRMGMYE
ncbi:MAG TPA: hypothetical protein VFA15_04120, partial [Nitrososphaera sp.]|nr:hypothetical protein [Nitrososphaera sp.]